MLETHLLALSRQSSLPHCVELFLVFFSTQAAHQRLFETKTKSFRCITRFFLFEGGAFLGGSRFIQWELKAFLAVKIFLPTSSLDLEFDGFVRIY